MLVSERVLGSHLDLEGVAADVRTETARRFRDLVSNDSDLSAGDRIERVERLALTPGIRMALACEDDERARYLVIAHSGHASIIVLADSRSPDRLDPPAAIIHPAVPVSGDVDAVIQRLAAGGAIDPAYDLGDGTLRLPFEWRSRDELVRTLVELAPQLGSPSLLVDVAGRRFEITMQVRRISCEPMHLVAPDQGPGYGAAFYELAKLAPPSREDRVELVIPQRPLERAPSTPPRDGGLPYTTGTAAQRRAAIAGQPRDFAGMIAALRDPANAGPLFDPEGGDLYLALAAHDSSVIAGLFLWALQEETESVIDTVTSLAGRQALLRAALPDLAEAAESRGDPRTAVRMRAAIDEARA